jgi:hypothetical protein
VQLCWSDLKRDSVTCDVVCPNLWYFGQCLCCLSLSDRPGRHGAVQITSGKEHRVAVAQSLRQLRHRRRAGSGENTPQTETLCQKWRAFALAARDFEISMESEDAENFAEDSTAGKLLPSNVANGLGILRFTEALETMNRKSARCRSAEGVLTGRLLRRGIVEHK